MDVLYDAFEFDSPKSDAATAEFVDPHRLFHVLSSLAFYREYHIVLRSIDDIVLYARIFPSVLTQTLNLRPHMKGVQMKRIPYDMIKNAFWVKFRHGWHAKHQSILESNFYDVIKCFVNISF